jgi:hypothetical protein
MFVLESLQNVSRHSHKYEHSDMSLVVYSRNVNGYTVSTGNAIPVSGVNELRLRLDEINKLNSIEIREAYRQMLMKSEISGKGGAGLGLIEMAKKTGNKLDYSFVELDNEFCYFILSKTVDSEGIGVHLKTKEEPFNSNAVTGLEKMMSENNIYLIWSGHLSLGIEKEVLSFTETKLTEEDIELSIRKRVFSILVEILENVANYSPGREAEEEYGMPVAMIRLVDKVYLLTTGNLVLNSKVDQLKRKLDTINKYDKLGLKDLFTQSLSAQTIRSDSTGNMGLIEMARKSGSKLTYQFETVNELYSYYTLTVRVEYYTG